MMQNPEMMQQMMQMMSGGGAGGAGGAGEAGFNPFAAMGAGMGGFGGQQQQAPVDNTPPEERYASQLQQLNDMGFYEFERNVQALRRSGGNVQGAVEHLLS
jgi:ubiquilin